MECEKIFSAIFNNNVFEVKRLVLEHKCANFESKTRQYSPLFYASSYSDTHYLVKILVSHGAKVNTPEYKDSPLCTAMRYRGNYNTVAYLLDNGAKVYDGDNDNYIHGMPSEYIKIYNDYKYIQSNNNILSKLLKVYYNRFDLFERPERYTNES